MKVPSFLALVGAHAVSAAGATGSSSKSLPVSMTCQEADFWCWAAVTQTVEEFNGTSVAQVDIATDHVSKSQPTLTCSAQDPSDPNSLCGNPCGGSCNSPHILSRVLIERGLMTAPSARKITPSFRDVVDAVDNGKPLPVRMQITTGNGGGHFICVTGYADDGAGNRFVDVLDPLVPGMGAGAGSLTSVPFATFVGGQYSINGDLATPNFVYDV